MKRLLYSRILPLLIFLFMLFWFFLPEIDLLYNSGISLIKQNCLFEKIQHVECKNQIIEIETPKSALFGLKTPMQIIIQSDIEKELIDLDKSKVYRLGAYIKQENESDITAIIRQAFGKLSVHEEIPVILIDSDCGTENCLNKLVAKSDVELEEGYTLIYHINILTTEGKEYFTYVYGTNTDSILGYFIVRISYLILYLLWYAAIFGGAIKGVTWSVIYDSVTKEPISGAIVRIFKEGRLYKTIVSDRTGVIHARVERGKYTINVIKDGYHFPSKNRLKIVDEEYQNLYYGTELEVNNDNSLFKLNIPLDPVSSEYSTEKNIGRGVINTLGGLTTTFDHMNPYILGFISIGQLIVWFDFVETWVFAILSLILISIQFIVKKRFEDQMGIVIDKYGKKLSGIRIDIYEAEWNRLVKSTNTDEEGRYEFILPMGDYYFLVVNNEYKIEGLNYGDKLPVALEGKRGSSLRVNQKIVLEKIVAN